MEEYRRWLFGVFSYNGAPAGDAVLGPGLFGQSPEVIFVSIIKKIEKIATCRPYVPGWRCRPGKTG